VTASPGPWLKRLVLFLVEVIASCIVVPYWYAMNLLELSDTTCIAACYQKVVQKTPNDRQSLAARVLER